MRFCKAAINSAPDRSRAAYRAFWSGNFCSSISPHKLSMPDIVTLKKGIRKTSTNGCFLDGGIAPRSPAKEEHGTKFFALLDNRNVTSGFERRKTLSFQLDFHGRVSYDFTRDKTGFGNVSHGSAGRDRIGHIGVGGGHNRIIRHDINNRNLCGGRSTACTGEGNGHCAADNCKTGNRLIRIAARDKDIVGVVGFGRAAIVATHDSFIGHESRPGVVSRCIGGLVCGDADIARKLRSRNDEIQPSVQGTVRNAVALFGINAVFQHVGNDLRVEVGRNRKHLCRNKRREIGHVVGLAGNSVEIADCFARQIYAVILSGIFSCAMFPNPSPAVGVRCRLTVCFCRSFRDGKRGRRCRDGFADTGNGVVADRAACRKGSLAQRERLRRKRTGDSGGVRDIQLEGVVQTAGDFAHVDGRGNGRIGSNVVIGDDVSGCGVNDRDFGKTLYEKVRGTKVKSIHGIDLLF
nr:MAG TPA: hypothetical protein [Caudoviricetes sp.]